MQLDAIEHRARRYSKQNAIDICITHRCTGRVEETYFRRATANDHGARIFTSSLPRISSCEVVDKANHDLFGAAPPPVCTPCMPLEDEEVRQARGRGLTTASFLFIRSCKPKKERAEWVYAVFLPRVINIRCCDASSQFVNI